MIYDDMLVNSGASSQSLRKPLAKLQISGQHPRSNSQVGNNGTNYFDMNKLIDIFDEEQELLYQRAIKQW
jgi:hypothetical protein